jgi:hypothetical protein
VQVKHGLTRTRPDEDHQPVVGQAHLPGSVRDELEHALRFLLLEHCHVAKGLEMALRQDEQMDVRLRIDVLDRNEAVGAVDDRGRRVARDDPAEDATRRVRQRESPPP